MHTTSLLLALLPATAMAVMPRQASSAAAPMITSPPQVSGDNPCAVLIDGFIGVCEAETINFDFLATSVQASCLCYNTVPPPVTTWIGPAFDGAVSGCSSLLSSLGQPASAAVVGSLNNFCSKAGNFQKATVTDAQVTSFSFTGTRSTTARATGTSTASRNATATTTRPIQFTGAAATANLGPYLAAAGGALAAAVML